ncbi:MAG TPA: peptidase S9, partial [Desulfobacteraceae bacterium]|nr:peptidase S9 [Desulfobacteraceae bacterium]
MILFVYSCQPVEKTEQSSFDLSLTEQEKEKGVMTPEILWKFRRMGGISPSPDGNTVLFTLSDYNVSDEGRRTNIFSLPADGGEAVQLTHEGGTSPSWIMNGEKIAFTNSGSLFTMNPDGSGKKKVENMNDFEIYSVSPRANMIYFTRRVKLDPAPNEKHGMPMANMRIIDDLMFRHWNYWHDYSYSHIFIAFFDGESIT